MKTDGARPPASAAPPARRGRRRAVVVPEENRRAFLALAAALLAYPGADFPTVLAEGEAWLAADRPPAALAAPFGEALAALAALAPVERERRYVALFDFAPERCLRLTPHETGEGRGQGMALLRLQQEMAREGWRPRGGDLPDSLPLLLAFLAVRQASPTAGELPRRLRRAALAVAARLPLEEGRPWRRLLEAVAAALPDGPAGEGPREAEPPSLPVPFPLPWEAVGADPPLPPGRRAR